LAALAHQINLITSKIVEVDPHNMEHYSIENVNREKESAPFNWTYADVVTGRIRFQQARTNVGNVWNLPLKSDASTRTEISSNDIKVSRLKKSNDISMHDTIQKVSSQKHENRNKHKRSKNAHLNEQIEKEKVEKPFEVLKIKETVQPLLDISTELKNVKVESKISDWDESKTYADILKGLRESLNKNNNIINYNNNNDNKRSIDINRIAQDTNEVVNKTESTGTIPKTTSIKREKMKHKKHTKSERSVQPMDGGGSKESSQRNEKGKRTNVETSSTSSGEDFREDSNKSKHRQKKQKSAHVKEDVISEGGYGVNKRVILIEHEAFYKVPVQQINLSLPQTYAVKVDERNIKAVTVETAESSIQKVKFTDLCIDDSTSSNDFDEESVSTATLDTVIESGKDFPKEKNVILIQEHLSDFKKLDKIEEKRYENIQEYTDTSEDEVMLQGKLEISFIVENDVPKIEHDIHSTSTQKRSKKHRSNEEGLDNDFVDDSLLDDVLENKKMYDGSDIMDKIDDNVKDNIAGDTQEKINYFASNIIKKIEDAQARVEMLPEIEPFIEEKHDEVDYAARIMQISNDIITKIDDTKNIIDEIFPPQVDNKESPREKDDEAKSDELNDKYSVQVIFNIIMILIFTK
jgi:hypothetical protein